MSTGKPSALVIIGTPDGSLERALVECGLSLVELASREQAEARLAESLFDVALLPFLLQPVATERASFQNDNLHPVAAAQPKLRDHVWTALVPLLK